MRAFVTLELDGDGQCYELGPGDFIGRSDQASLCTEDPRVSEAHAMVSLRGAHLCLLALRGRFRVNGKVEGEVVLREGLIVELAPGLRMHCSGVVLPTKLPGLRIPSLPDFVLASTTAVFLEPTPRVQRGYDASADAMFWPVGPRWFAMVHGQRRQSIDVGETIDVRGTAIDVVTMSVGHAAQARTRRSLRAPLRFHPEAKRVRITTEGAGELSIGGVPGRILATLVTHGAAMHWQELVDEVWQGERAFESALRKRFDVGLARLRRKLQPLLAEGEELVVLDGAGALSLALGPDDSVAGPAR